MSYGENDNILTKIYNRYYPIGSYFITKTNVNPSSLGIKGTWVLKYKHLDADKVKDLNFITFASNTSNQAQQNHCDGYTIWIKGWCKSSGTFSDTNLSLGSLNIDSLSTTMTVKQWTGLAWHHTATAGLYLLHNEITTSTRNVNFYIAEVYNRTGTRSYTASTNVHFEFPLYLNPEENLQLKDEVCNEFYWLRTA